VGHKLPVRCRKLHNEELHNLYSLSKILAKKSIRARWTCRRLEIHVEFLSQNLKEIEYFGVSLDGKIILIRILELDIRVLTECNWFVTAESRGGYFQRILIRVRRTSSLGFSPRNRSNYAKATQTDVSFTEITMDIQVV
jgi:hypothetical protein